MTKSKTSTPKALPFETAKEAFDAVASRIEAVPTTDLAPINVDIPTAVTVALGAAPRLASLLDVAKQLPGFDVDAMVNLRTYAMAALYAHVATVRVRQDDGGYAELLAEATALRGDLLVAADALAHRGLMSAERVAEVRAGQGHLDTANDLVALSALFVESWSEVRKKTAVTQEEVERAALLGSQLHVALGLRKVGANESVADEPAKKYQRERAFTLFARAYDECRRAATYLRWHEGDAEEYAPSIYVRRRRRGSSEDAAPTTPASEVPTAPVQVTSELEPVG